MTSYAEFVGVLKNFLKNQENSLMSSLTSYKVLVASFNVNTRDIDQDLSSWLLADTSNPTIPDILAIGLQELAPYPVAFKSDAHLRHRILHLVILIEKALSRFSSVHNSETFTCISQTQHVGRILFVFTRDTTVTKLIRAVHTNFVGVGVLNLMGNKGALGCWVTLTNKNGEDEEDLELCFVNTHLAPHDWNIKRRNNDFNSIVERLVVPNLKPNLSRDSLRHDSTNPTEYLVINNINTDQPYRTIYSSHYTFFFGDLNYRIDLYHPIHADLSISNILSFVESSLESLHPYDQLIAERSFGRTLRGFQEGPLNFPPTYKFLVGKINEYSFRVRTPSWCDRILYRHRTIANTTSEKQSQDDVQYSTEIEAITLHFYTSHMSYTLSDHKPVSCLFTIRPHVLGSLSPTVFFSYPAKVDTNWKLKRDVGLVLDRLVGWLWWGFNMSSGVFIISVAVFGGYVMLTNKK